MKKLWLIPALALTFTACGNDEEAAVDEEEDSVEMVEFGEMDTEETPSNTSLADYEESNLLADNIPLDQLTPLVEEDNQNKRIILFEDEAGEKVYKSVFIKNDEYLKIIDIKDEQNDEGLIYEGRL